MRKEETKKHKGKTPSFGNTNNPLFLNNFEIDGDDMNRVLDTHGNLRREELKTDRRSYNKNPSTDLTDKFSAPILSHRETRKAGSKRPARGGQRQRNTFSKVSPSLHKSTTQQKSPTHIGTSTPKPGHFGKIFT